MARNETLTLASDQWMQLTNGDVTALRVENQGTRHVYLQATAGGGTAPTSTSGALSLGPAGVVAADLTLAQLWPGVAGANRVWAYQAEGIVVPVSVSHA